MAFDAHSNLALAQVVIGPSPALSGTTLTVTASLVSLFPATPFNATVYPAGVSPTYANAEIVRVTNISGTTLTITRAQEGTTAKAIAPGWNIANTASKKVFTDIENAMIQFVAAGGVSAPAPTVVFSNSNNVSFGAAGSIITASASQAPQGTISAGTASVALGQVIFSNSNGVSFGLSGSTVTASAVGGGGGGGAAISAGTQSTNGGTVVFSNSNSITFGMSNNSVVTASFQQSVQQAISEINAGTQQAINGVNFVNSNGITFGMSGSSQITASHNGLTSQSNQAASAGNGSFAFQTISFSNANGVSFSTTAGSAIVASVGAGVGAGSVSAGTTSVALGQVVFSNSNGVSFGLNGSTVTASVSGGGATLNGISIGRGLVPIGNGYAGNRVSVFPFQVFESAVFDRFQWFVSHPGGAATGTVSSTVNIAIYTSTGGTLSTVFYASEGRTFTYSGNWNSLVTGTRYDEITFAQTTLSPGNYFAGFCNAITWSSTPLVPAVLVAATMGGTYNGKFNQTVSTSNQMYQGFGLFTNTSITSCPASIAFSDLQGTNVTHRNLVICVFRQGSF